MGKIRLGKLAKEFNVAIATIVDFLEKSSISVKTDPNYKIDEKTYNLLLEEFKGDKAVKKASDEVVLKKHIDDQTISARGTAETQKATPEKPVVVEKPPVLSGPKVIKKIDLSPPPKKKPLQEEEPKEEKKEAGKEAGKEVEKKVEKATEKEEEKKPKRTIPEEPNVIKAQAEKLDGLKVTGKIDVSSFKTPEKKTEQQPKTNPEKKRRKRIQTSNVKVDIERERKQRQKQKGGGNNEVDEAKVQKTIKDTLERLTNKTKSKAVKYRKEKRQAIQERIIDEETKASEAVKVLNISEFVSVSELAAMMNISPSEVISACMTLGLFVSINQRLDAETIVLIAEENGFTVNFVSIESQEAVEQEGDEEVDLVPRPPIVTVMGHVDHGKTSLLDYIRNANVIAGEAGGITQHIGAYHLTTSQGQAITFLDTPGHEAFTAMRARGAKVTDIAIIIIAADDSIMPQTKEAINHATAAGVPIVFAINKVDKEGANPNKIKEELAAMNFLIEEWGGKFQSQDISAKVGTGVEELLDKVLLEAEMLELKANPNRLASGTIIESSLDKGRGYVTTLLVQNGTLRKGDTLLSGQFFGNVKAMFNEREQSIDQAGPAVPLTVLGLSGAPQAGDSFNAISEEKEARNIANKREQLQREQSLRTKKHITLDEIGRRLAIGGFQELNVVVKGDVGGSVEALSASLTELSTEEIQLNVIHQGVGQITETDVMLASASNAIIIGFQVRPSLVARQLAEKEQIDIRIYSVIYSAINEIKDALSGMLSPEISEQVVGTVEIMEVYKIPKVGNIAGCVVRDGKVQRESNVRLIREGIVVYDGKLASLKRFKDDAKEVTKGYECGLNIANYNDIKVGDIIEIYIETETQRSLD